MSYTDPHTTMVFPPIPDESTMQAWATRERARIDARYPERSRLIPNANLIRDRELAMVDQTLRFARYVRRHPGQIVGRGRNHTWAYEYNTIARMDQPWHVHARRLAERGGLEGVRHNPGGG